MSGKSFGICSKNVVTPFGVRHAVVVVEGDTITGVYQPGDVPAGVLVDDVGSAVVMPGLVDSHVHINEPGRSEWEGFVTATRAAAAGGITTMADMPLNSIPVTTSKEALVRKIEAANTRLWVDCAFYGGVVPGNADALEALIDAGVVGFKCFLIHSGVDDFPNVSQADLRQIMPLLAQHRIPLLVHAELENHYAEESPALLQWNDARSYNSFLNSRPGRWEDDAIALMIDLCAEFNCPVHIVHLSSAQMLPEIANALDKKLPFTVETCPHYLTFAAEDIADGDTRFKCAPPIRDRENRKKLWGALRQGIISMVVSDHSPCIPELKFLAEGDLKRAWGGISSLQFRLPVVWTEAKKRGFTLEHLAAWLCSGPADFLALGDRKGRLAVGYNADIVIWDADELVEVAVNMNQHRHKVTPYEGRALCGKVQQTYLRGQKIFDRGDIIANPLGTVLLRQRSGLSEASRGLTNGT